MDGKRKFLQKVVASGLERGVITTDDVVAHADAKVLAEHLPVELKAKVIAAALGAKKMTTALIVETLGTEAVAKHLPMSVVWGCVSECAERALGDAAPARENEKSKDKGKAADKSSGKEAKPSDARESDKADKVDKPEKAARSESDKSSAKGKSDSAAKSLSVANAEEKSNGVAKDSPVSMPKPNAKARPKPPPARAATAKPGPLGRRPTSPLIPKNEFDVDTDVGDEDWGVDDIVEVVEEAEVVGAEPLDDTRLTETGLDWKNDEETVTREGKP